MIFYLYLFALVIWISIHSTVSVNYKWKSSIISCCVYFCSLFLFNDILHFHVAFYLTGICFILMTIGAFYQRNNYEEKKKLGQSKNHHFSFLRK